MDDAQYENHPELEVRINYRLGKLQGQIDALQELVSELRARLDTQRAARQKTQPSSGGKDWPV